VAAAVAAQPPGAFLVESLLSCGGQIILPAGYLPAAFAAVRAAGMARDSSWGPSAAVYARLYQEAVEARRDVLTLAG
jgi:hypothetical protein